jgi:DNA replication regulator DPB11
MLRRRGKRYDDEDQAIVYEEWLWDCVGYRGRWPEKDYDARKPRAQGKVTPEEVLDGSVYERLRPAPPAPVDEEQPIVVRKRRRGTRNELLGELLAASNVPTPDVATPEANVNPEPGPEADPDVQVIEAPPPSRTGNAFERKESRLHATRTGAFDAGPSRTSAPTEAPKRVAEKKLFADLRFSHTIDADTATVLEDAIRLRSGTWVSEAERLGGAEVDYVIVRL